MTPSVLRSEICSFSGKLEMYTKSGTRSWDKIFDFPFELANFRPPSVRVTLKVPKTSLVVWHKVKRTLPGLYSLVGPPHLLSDEQRLVS